MSLVRKKNQNSGYLQMGNKVLRIVLHNLLGFFAGYGLFVPRKSNNSNVPLKVLVLSPGEIPTTQLYLHGRLAMRFHENVHYVDTLKTRPQEISLDDDSMIVIVRNIPRCWLLWIKNRRQQLTSVVYLMDDDIPSALRAKELAFDYAIKTAWRYALSRRLLGQVCSEIWLSTPELIQRYAASSPRLVEPEFVVPHSLSGGTTIVYFYHGTWAHRMEIKWLVPIIRRIQKNHPNSWFEIIGTDQVKDLFRNIPRVRVVHPMPWKDYLAYAGTVKYHIGLAPCFDSDFNRARSHSKVFDITRLGAAGIYSNVTPYKEKVVHGKTGFLCTNDQDKWVAALTMLLRDQELRTSLYLGARDWCSKSTVLH